MNARFTRQILTFALAVAVFYALLGTEVQCTPAEARPSLESLQAQIDDLRSEALRVFDGNGNQVGIPVAGPGQVYLPAVEAVAAFNSRGGGPEAGVLSDSEAAYYESADCTGPPLFLSARRVVHNLAGEVFVTGNGSTLFAVHSIDGIYGCNVLDGDWSYYLVHGTQIDPATDLGLPSYPLAVPLYIAPTSAVP